MGEVWDKTKQTANDAAGGTSAIPCLQGEERPCLR